MALIRKSQPISLINQDQRGTSLPLMRNQGAADDAQVTIAARPGRTVVRRSFVVVAPTILRPLPDVADHIVEAESIRGERPDRRGLLAAPLAAAAVAVGHRLAVQLDLVPPWISRLSSGARRIFVLALGEQPIVLASDPGEPFHISLRIVPAHFDRGPPAAPPAAFDDMRLAIAVGGAGVPFVERQR